MKKINLEKMIKEEIKNILKEDGGSYTVQINIADVNTSFDVHIKDSEGFRETREFETIIELKNYLIEYLNSWDVS